MTDKLDQVILIAVQSWRRPFLTKVLTFFTYSATARAWFSAAIILNVLHLTGMHFAKENTVVLRALYAPLLAWVVSSILKRIFQRQRPSEEIPGFKLVIVPPACGSFPSSHASSTFAFFTAFALVSHPWAPFVGAWAVIVSFSRLYLGVHYLSDILGGAIVGVACACLVRYIYLWSLVPFG